jgi:hypothetical protein
MKDEKGEDQSGVIRILRYVAVSTKVRRRFALTVSAAALGCLRIDGPKKVGFLLAS